MISCPSFADLNDGKEPKDDEVKSVMEEADGIAGEKTGGVNKMVRFLCCEARRQLPLLHSIRDHLRLPRSREVIIASFGRERLALRSCDFSTYSLSRPCTLPALHILTLLASACLSTHSQTRTQTNANSQYELHLPFSPYVQLHT